MACHELPHYLLARELYQSTSKEEDTSNALQHMPDYQRACPHRHSILFNHNRAGFVIHPWSGAGELGTGDMLLVGEVICRRVYGALGTL